MRGALIAGLAAAALAGCGGASAQAQRDARCRSENLAWARGYLDSLPSPSPASPAQVQDLAAPLIQACEQGTLKP